MLIQTSVVALLTTIVSASGTTPPSRCASAVIAYEPGSGTGASYRNPAAALGEPTRFTGTGVEPGAVTPFRPAFMPGEIVSVGRGGVLVLAFEEPVLDDPRHPHGVDLIVYGNVISSLQREWGIGTAAAGTLGSLAFVGMMIGAVLAGRLSDAIGRKRAVIGCAVLVEASGEVHAEHLI